VAALAADAAGAADELAARLPLAGDATRLLDLGGGHGLYAAALCRRHAALRATVLDLPEAIAEARRHVAASGVEDRIELAAGDLRTAAWDAEPWDAILLLDVTPHLTDADNARLLERAAAALRPGGLLCVSQPAWDAGAGPSRQLAAVSELLFFLTSGRRPPEPARLWAWLTRAGLAPIRRLALAASPRSLVLVGRARPL
jgi:2-polyprenyl-3-methyl-5-hydroxy-6-metoxy-1,4-benzoquinol methylase